MKGLMKYLSPFAPDQSGAVSVLYGLGALIVIIDAGGCTGNVCGFDEPRWLEYLENGANNNGGTKKSMIYSAGLRDMDAILGRDRELVDKICGALSYFTPNFIALVGTPVPAVIATDYMALIRMLEKRTGIATVAIPTTGMKNYDIGQKMAYFELCRKFAKIPPDGGKRDFENKTVGVFGATPLDTISETSKDAIMGHLQNKGFGKIIFVGDDYNDLSKIPVADSLMAVSPSGMDMALEIGRNSGIPVEISYPLDVSLKKSEKKARALIIHQHTIASSLGRALTAALSNMTIDVASFFEIPQNVGNKGDGGCNIRLAEEDDLIMTVSENHYDAIFADPQFFPVIGGFTGDLIPLPHFAVSGSLHRQKHDAGFMAPVLDYVASI